MIEVRREVICMSGQEAKQGGRKQEAMGELGRGNVEEAKEKWEVGCPERTGKSPFCLTFPLPP
jgi:hypothetical protein